MPKSPASSFPNTKEIIEGLNLAYKERISEGVLIFKENISIAPQVRSGKSDWAKFLKEGVIDPWDVVWAFIPDESGKPKLWLATRIQVDEESFFFNLRNRDDRIRMKKMINRFKFLQAAMSESKGERVIEYADNEDDEEPLLTL